MGPNFMSYIGTLTIHGLTIGLSYRQLSITTIKQMASLGTAKPMLPPECYEIAMKVICIMIVPYCTSDGYIVGMYNYDVCMKLVGCGISFLGTGYLENMCHDLTPKYSDQLYNGTDHISCQVVEEEEQKQTSSTIPLSNIVTVYIEITSWLVSAYDFNSRVVKDR